MPTKTRTATGSESWQLPSNATGSVIVECWGAGGSGGSGASSSGNGGSGGAGGAYAKKTYTVGSTITAGSNYTLFVGSGGPTATSPNSGTAGTDSYFNTNTDCMAKGGAAGTYNSTSVTTADANTASYGDTRYAGGNGAAGASNAGGAGGSSAGTAAAGNAGSGTGQTSAPSGGGYGGASSSTSNGSPGGAPGGGGGGGNDASNSGGAGADGQIIVTYTIVTNSSGNDTGTATLVAARTSLDTGSGETGTATLQGAYTSTTNDTGTATLGTSYTSSLTSLSGSTHYYGRAYVTTAAGTAYGALIQFDTASAGTPRTTMDTPGYDPTGTATLRAARTSLDTASGETGSATLQGARTSLDTASGETGTATLRGAKTSDGNDTGTATLRGAATSNGNDTGTAFVQGSYTSPLTGLSTLQHYYVRAYATNAGGTSYGAVVEFNTPGSATFDRDGSATLRGAYTSTTNDTGTATLQGARTSSGNDTGTATLSPPVTGRTTQDTPGYDPPGTATLLAQRTSTTNDTGAATLRGAYTSTTNDTGTATLRAARTSTTNDTGTATLRGAYTSTVNDTGTATLQGARTSSGNDTGTATLYDGKMSDPVEGTAVLRAARTSTTNDTGTATLAAQRTSTTNDTGTATLAGARTSSGNDTGTATLRGARTGDVSGTATILSSDAFVSYLTELVPLAHYYVRAYATNDGGTSYGDVQEFTTSGAGEADAQGTAVLTLENAFVSPITGLLPDTLYHVRAYATNADGTSYGNDVIFHTTGPRGADATGSAVLSSSAYVSSLTGLLPETHYYVRAYATNSTGTAYGAAQEFDTTAGAPQMGSVDGSAQLTDVHWGTATGSALLRAGSGFRGLLGALFHARMVANKSRDADGSSVLRGPATADAAGSALLLPVGFTTGSATGTAEVTLPPASFRGLFGSLFHARLYGVRKGEALGSARLVVGATAGSAYGAATLLAQRTADATGAGTLYWYNPRTVDEAGSATLLAEASHDAAGTAQLVIAAAGDAEGAAWLSSGPSGGTATGTAQLRELTIDGRVSGTAVLAHARSRDARGSAMLRTVHRHKTNRALRRNIVAPMQRSTRTQDARRSAQKGDLDPWP